MVNIMGLALGIVAFLAVTFVINSFVLQKEFDIVSALFNLATVLVALWIGSKLVRFTGKSAKPEVKI